ncbi:MAG: enoyl-CoA hydratase-related protein, partial [Ilumatobacteraceae bacterium]
MNIPGVTSERVVMTVVDGVADIRMNRPDKRNALDNEMFTSLAAAGDYVKTLDEVRVVVLSGEGASFCAGLDFGSFQAMAGGSSNSGSMNAGSMENGRITHLAQQVCWVWQEVPVPVIAAVHGHALGGGMQIALGTDIRIVHPDTQLSV